MWFLVAAGVVFVLALAGAAALVFVRTRSLLAEARAFMESVGYAAEGLGLAVEATTSRMERVSARSEERARRFAHLRSSHGELRVLLAAVSDVRASVGRLTAVMPRK